MAEVAIKAEKRDARGKGRVHEIRRLGKVPGVIYGSGREAEAVAVDARELGRFISSEGAAKVFTLDYGKTGLPVLLKDVQRNPLTGALLHADFYAVNLNEPVHTTVPLHFVGEEKRPSDGGVIQFGLRHLEIKCLPGNIPEHVEVDLSRLGLGDNLTVSDLKAGEDFEILAPAEDVVVSVIAPSRAIGAEAEAKPAEGAGGDGAAAGVAPGELIVGGALKLRVEG